MLFRKLRFNEQRSGLPQETWYMIMRTPEDVIAYMKIDAELSANALKALPESITKSHLDGTRERILNAMMQTDAWVGKEIKPWETLEKMVKDKAHHLLDLVNRGEEVLMRQVGSYCPFRGSLELWNATVVKEVEKDSCYFPGEEESFETEILFIENSERVSPEFLRHAGNLVGYDMNSKEWASFNDARSNYSFDKTKKVKYVMTHLKLKDPNFVAGMIAKANTVAFVSKLADNDQADKMFGLFSQLKGKRVIIRTEYREKLEKHPLYEKCKQLHRIEFI